MQYFYSHVLTTLQVVRHSLWLPSNIQVIVECGRALMLGGAVHHGKQHTLTPFLRLLPYSTQAPPAYTHKATRTTRSIDIRATCLNHRAPTQPEETTRKLRPQASSAQIAFLAWRLAPDVAHLLLLRVWWSGGEWWGVGCGWWCFPPSPQQYYQI